MYNSEFFRISDGKIKLIKYKAQVLKYKDIEKTEIDDIDFQYLIDDDELQRLITNFINKHKKIELGTVEELDSSEFSWMEGIEMRTQDTVSELEKIASYGNRDAYEASLEENIASSILDNDFRLTKLELGI